MDSHSCTFRPEGNLVEDVEDCSSAMGIAVMKSRIDGCVLMIEGSTEGT